MKVVDWYNLGLKLGIECYDLEVIQADHTGVKAQTRAMFIKWLKICTTPSWKAIITALKKINEKSLANEVAAKLNQQIE